MKGRRAQHGRERAGLERQALAVADDELRTRNVCRELLCTRDHLRREVDADSPLDRGGGRANRRSRPATDVEQAVGRLEIERRERNLLRLCIET